MFALATSGCTLSGARDGSPEQAVAGVRAIAAVEGARAKVPTEATTVLTGASPEELAIATSATLYDLAPLVVLAAIAEPAAVRDAVPVAARLGAPLLLTPTTPAPDVVRLELDRLGAQTLLTFGTSAAAWARASAGDRRVVAAPPETAEVIGDPSTLGPTLGPARAPAANGSELRPTLSDNELAGAAARLGLPPLTATEPADSVLVLASSADAESAATATARASGARVHVLAVADPRADSAVIADLAAEPPRAVVALGAQFGAPELLRRRLDVAATGVELPGSGQLLFPSRRLVALYGTPGSSSLGALGEQPLEATLARAQRVAGDYAPLSNVPVVPALEIIATVASDVAGSDGNYSSERSVEDLRAWVERAGAAGVYVVLDLQPGRSDFLTQAKRYEELLALPHVGLALDPEWRLRLGQRHMAQIGSVGVGEVNQVITWLAALTRERDLPQKLLILHQFRQSMISDRGSLDMGHEELAVLIHVDGNGTRPQKQSTWTNLTASPPAGSWLGWKNFYDEDTPTYTPSETMAVTPTPFFISYQ
jgi:hypothetical protein